MMFDRFAAWFSKYIDYRCVLNLIPPSNDTSRLQSVSGDARYLKGYIFDASLIPTILKGKGIVGDLSD